MDHGQPLAGNDCNTYCGCGESTSYTESQTKRSVAVAIPDWMQNMLNEANYHTTWMQPIMQREVKSENRRAVWANETAPRFLENHGWSADAILRNIEKGGNAAEQLREQIGDEAVNSILENIRFVVEPVTEQALIQKGTEQMQPVKYGHSTRALLRALDERNILGHDGTVKQVPSLISNNVKRLAEIDTLADVVSAHILPDFMKQLTDALEITDAVERLREQNRIINRLQKLISYTRKPGLISPTTIACAHEFAIYQWQQFRDVVQGKLTEEEALHDIFTVGGQIADRKKAAEENTEMQLKNQRRATVMEKILSQVNEVENLINGLETVQLAKKFRDMADDLERVEAGGEVSQQAPLPFSNAVTPEEGEVLVKAPEFRSGLMSDNSDMGLDYRRVVPTMSGGTSVRLVPGSKTVFSADQADHDFIQSIIGRLQNGEAIPENDLIHAARRAKVIDPNLFLELSGVVGTRMMGKTPFIQ